MPSFSCLATAFGTSLAIAGNTTASVPTMLWQSLEPMKATHLRASALCLLPTQIASARPLYMLQLPFGPARLRRIADLDALGGRVGADRPVAVDRQGDLAALERRGLAERAARSSDGM